MFVGAADRKRYCPYNGSVGFQRIQIFQIDDVAVMYADKTRRKPAFQVAQLPVKRMCFVSGYDVHLMALAEKILNHIEGNSQTSSAVIQKETGFSCQIQCGKSASQRSDDLLLFVGLQNIVQGEMCIRDRILSPFTFLRRRE